MKNEAELKNLLTSIKENNYKVPGTIDINELTLNMLNNIGSLNEELRDHLIFNVFQRLILNGRISKDQMKEILKLSLSEKHLFYGLGKKEDDSVFNRTFTMLIIADIIESNNKAEDKFLTQEEVVNVFNKVMEYYREEKDLRGYVEGKGWAHSTAHASDALGCLVESNCLNHVQLMEILKVIKDKVCVTNYTYINEEDERIINTFMCIYNRNIITLDEIINWISSFKDVICDEEPGAEHLRENRKVFFRSLYFRAKKYKVENKVLEAVEDVLESLPAYY